MKAKTIAEIVIAGAVGLGIYLLYEYLSGNNILAGLAGLGGALSTDLFGNASQVQANITKGATTISGSYYSPPGYSPSAPSTTPTQRTLGPNGQALLDSINSAVSSSTLQQTQSYSYSGDYLGSNPIFNQSVSGYQPSNMSSLTESGSPISTSGIGVSNSDLYQAQGAFAKAMANNLTVQKGLIANPATLPSSQMSGLSTASELLSPLSASLPAGLENTALGTGYATNTKLNGTTEVAVPTINLAFPTNLSGNANIFDTKYTAYVKKESTLAGEGKITNQQMSANIGNYVNQLNSIYNTKKASPLARLFGPL